MMRLFSVSRFLKILRYFFADNRRFWLVRYKAVFTLMLTIICIDTISQFSLGTSEYLYWLGGDLKYEVIMFMLFFVFLDGTTMIDRYVNTKSNRIKLFMIPSSNAEKFLSLVVMSYPMACMYMILGVATADVINYVLQCLLGFDNPAFVLSGAMERFVEYCGASGLTGVPLYLAMAKTILSWATISMLFLFASIALKKRSRMNVLVIMFMMALAFHFLIFSKSSGVSDGNVMVVSDAITAIAARVAFIVLCLWASYRSFVHMQIVDQKLINL